MDTKWERVAPCVLFKDGPFTASVTQVPGGTDGDGGEVAPSFAIHTELKRGRRTVTVFKACGYQTQDEAQMVGAALAAAVKVLVPSGGKRAPRKPRAKAVANA